MSKKRAELKHPGRFLFDMDELAAEKFRKYCADKHLIIGGTIGDIIIDFLVKEGVLYSRESLEVERQMSK